MTRRSPDTPLLQARGLVRDIGRRGAAPTRILHGIDIDLAPGETLGIIGASGSGKSTLARILMALEKPDAGTLRIDGLDPFGGRDRSWRPRLQAVFQDPFGSLDPRLRTAAIVGEPLAAAGIRGEARAARVREALDAVALPASVATRYPHEFSGGQRQRIAIARAIATRPAIVIADEPVSALDVSVQAQVLNLLIGLRERTGLALVFISHDLDVIRHVSHRVAVLEAGRIVEEGPASRVLDAPGHTATRYLLAARHLLATRAGTSRNPPPVAGAC